ncbi:MAG: ion transporter [Armatimonadota bacterium]
MAELDRELRGDERQVEETLRRERWELLDQLVDWLETPMVILGFVWLGLFVAEILWGPMPLLEQIGTVIWGIFVVDFLVKFALAPEKLPFLRSQWLTVLALALPALRVFRIVRVLRLLRATRAARGVRFFRLITSLNRGIRAVRSAFGRRGFGYVLVTAVLVTFAGAAGMLEFEKSAPGGGFRGYPDALWWTGMLMTTLGSEYWPRTAEGRLLSFILSLFATAIFGYVTATLASYFIGRDAQEAQGGVAGAEQLQALQQEIAALRAEIAAVSSAGTRRQAR